MEQVKTRTLIVDLIVENGKEIYKDTWVHDMAWNPICEFSTPPENEEELLNALHAKPVEELQDLLDILESIGVEDE